jgi:hypothetical protein
MPTRFTRAALRAAALGLGALVSLSACSADVTDPTALEERPQSLLNLLTVSPTAPALATTSTSFYAVAGRGTGVDLWYRPRAGQRDSTKFLEFRLGTNSLAVKPDGSAFAKGDSIRITLTVRDPAHIIIDFLPSGLRFSANDKPKLKLFFSQVDDDVDHDGKVDQHDDELEGKLAIWRQESIGQPWFKMASAVVKDSREVDADLTGFTGYCLSY